MASAFEEQTHPSIFDVNTLIERGLCTVAKRRAAKTHKLYYELHGNRNAEKKIVFIMGLNNSCFGWSNQVDYFGKKDGYQVLVFDNRGVGNSETGVYGAYKTSEMAKDVLELLDHVGWTAPRSVHVDGVSMGGMISQELCLLAPERIASLTLTSTKAGDRHDFPPWKGFKMFFRLFSGTVTPEGAIKLIVDGLFPPIYLDRPEPSNPSITKRDQLHIEFLRRFNLARRQPFSGRMGQLAAALGHSVSKGQLEEIAKDIPKVSIITGDTDYLINPKRSEELHEMLPGSELVVIKDGGHALPSQIPVEYNAALERWVEEAFANCKTVQA